MIWSFLFKVRLISVHISYSFEYLPPLKGQMETPMEDQSMGLTRKGSQDRIDMDETSNAEIETAGGGDINLIRTPSKIVFGTIEYAEMWPR